MLILLKVLLLKENYNKFFEYVFKNLTLEKELKLILEALKELYEKFPEVQEFNLDELQIYFFANNNIKEKDKGVYESIFSNCRGLSVSEAVLESVLSSLYTKARAGELAIAAMEVAEGQRPVEDLSQFYTDLNNLPSAVEPVSFVTDNLEELYGATVATPGLRWRLNALNRSLGSLRRGDFGFIFARPETGKTTFLASEVTFFAGQVDSPILWFNNEEQGNKVMIRCYQAALGLELYDLMSRRETNARKFREITRGNIRLFDSAAIHRTEVERICEDLQPTLIVFDQIDKIKGFQDDREDLRLGAIYIWARELAKQYAPVVGVSQASGEGEGIKYLSMDHVSNAKTAKQAEADWILGIGKSHDPDFEHIRHFSICKNKLAGDPDTDPALRHGRIDVEIKPEIARYKDLLL